MAILFYHNPRCSKSREGLALLQQGGAELRVVEYLAHPPSEAELLAILEQLEDPAALVRSKEEKYRELRFDLSDRRAIAKNLAAHPELIERPLAVKGKVVVIGRPPENLKKLL